MSGVERIRIDTERNFLDVLDKVHEISARHRGPHARLHAVAGLRRLAAQDGREGQRRRPVLHAARSHPRHGAGHRSQDRRDGLRPRLRHRRLSGAGLRAHGAAEQSSDITTARPAGDAEAAHLLRPREGEPHLSHRPGQPGAARHRRAAHLARQHAHRRRDLWRTVRRTRRRFTTWS